MGRIYRRGNTWHAYYTDPQGEAQRRSLRTADRDVARARLRELELAATNPAAHSTHTLAGALDGLRVAMASSPAGTVSCYALRARHLVRLLGADLRLGRLNLDMTQGYIKTRLEEHAHPSTVAKETVVLRRALAVAAQRKLWSGDPRSIVPSVKTCYQPRERWLTEVEVAGLLAQLPPGRRLWVALGVYAGLRRSEIERIEREHHVDLARGVLRAPGRKTIASWRRVPIAADLARMIDEIAPAAGRLVEPWPCVIRDLEVAMSRAIEGNLRRGRHRRSEPLPPRPAAAKVTPNDLRRTFASWLIQRGVDKLVVADLLGHTSARQVERVYGRRSEAMYRDAIDLMPALCAAGVQPNQRPEAVQAVVANEPTPPNTPILDGNAVPRDGVEPPTRGFSVRDAVDVKANRRALLQERAPIAVQPACNVIPLRVEQPAKRRRPGRADVLPVPSFDSAIRRRRARRPAPPTRARRGTA